MEKEVVIKGINVATLFILYIWVTSNIMVDHKRKKKIKYCIILTAIVVACEIGCDFTDNTTPDKRFLSILFNTGGFAVTPFIMLVEGQIYTKDDVKVEKKVYILAILNCILALLSPFTGWIFYVSKANIYSRGNLFFIYIGTLLFYVLYSLIQKAIAVRNYPEYFAGMIISSGVFLFGSMMIQIFFPKYHTTWISITICLVFYYSFSCEVSSMIDGLTGLLNRTAYDHQIYCLEKNKESTTAIIMIDIDNFKMINDTKGHAYGDVCLKEVANFLKQTFCYKCQVFRYGGDEFVVVAEVESEQEVEKYRDNLILTLRRRHEENEDFPNVSVGYAIYDYEKDIQEVVNLADKNMYREKRNLSRKF